MDVDGYLNIKGGINFADATELTLDSGGAITITKSIHTVDTYSDTASDDLVTINGGTDGKMIMFRPNHTDRTIVIKETGNIYCGGTDISLEDTKKYVILIYDSVLTKWVVAGGSGLSGSDITIKTLAVDGADNNSRFYFQNSAADNLAIAWHSSQSAPEQTPAIHGRLTSGKVYNTIYNDVADFFELENEIDIEYGKVYVYEDNGNVRKSKEYCEMGILGIATDTYGFGVGHKSNKKQIPISVAGYVLAFVDKPYPSGTPLTSILDGQLTEMKREDVMKYPERIIGTFIKIEPKEEWNEILVNGRCWVKVK
jgi:hypothetical protein